MRKILIVCLFGLTMATSSIAQNIEQAKQQFSKGEFSEAKPVFKSFVKKYPTNAKYNFWYGACEYETGNAKDAISYLQKAAKGKMTNAYKYLGMAYYDLYMFEDSESAYQNYIDALVKSKESTDKAEIELDKIRTAARMIKGVEKVTVIDSFVVDKKNFLDSYKLSKASGKLSIIGGSHGTLYETEDGRKRIISQNSENDFLQLYNSIKMINDWSKPEVILSLRNNSNMNYPFLMTDGITLYYSSDGPESLGGYDIFVTRYDMEDGKYLKPDNIGMPFNSTYNDYMFAIDELNNVGWFASDRFQPDDKVCIYVFIPNDSKDVYDYENTNPALIRQAALLSPISATQGNKEKVEAAQKQFAAFMTGSTRDTIEKEFEFIIDDTRTYYSLSDFKSKKAANLYMQLVQKQKDYESLCKQLEKERENYIKENDDKKTSKAPAILDLEKRAEQMMSEIEKSTVNIRNKEITWKQQ